MENNKRDVQMNIVDGFDYIIEETGNSSLNLRKISWNGKNAKLDLRKWLYRDGEETPCKGVTITEEGADELSSVLVENGYGDTKRLTIALKKRDDFDFTVTEDDLDGDKEDENSDEDYYDPSELLGEIE